MADLIHLPMAEASVVLAVDSGGARIAYFDAPLGDIDPAELGPALDWPVPEAGLDVLAPIAILPETSRGFAAVPGIAGRRANGAGAAPRMGPAHVEQSGPGEVIVSSHDSTSQLTQHVTVCADEASSVVRLSVRITNDGEDDYALDGVTMAVPVPSSAAEVLTLGGRWSNEFRPQRHEWRNGTQVVENRRGRTSHDRLPFLAVGSPGFTEQSGSVMAAHVGWSGNSHLRAEVLRDGRRVLQAGELLLPGEVVLASGESYSSPTLYLATSGRGINGTSAALHRWLRSRPNHPRSARPVILNTWEAVYFNQDLATLSALADRAAEVGVERFVLDDGWFHGRRHDRAGLGDWWVDTSVWPDGLGPLARHVVDLGMQFGLWVEPEMVNPDSELYRSHPDWALVDADSEPVLARHQLVLDLINPDVFEYLRSHLDALLATYPISYLKWDMNRDLVAPQHDGRSAVRDQVLAAYRLMATLREAHPHIEIESCSSGGARADYGVLEHTDRVWTSDCNDALDRQRIQRGFSYVFPPELMGAHIGPPASHTTGRTHSLAFRAATAFFGHLGIEWNLLDAADDDRKALASVIAAYKRFRPLLHSGEVHRIDHPSSAIVAHAVIATDGASALVSVAQVGTADALAVGPVRIPGLDPDRTYEVAQVAMADMALGKAKRQPAWVDEGSARLSGRVLGAAGIALPVLHPESAIVLYLSVV